MAIHGIKDAANLIVKKKTDGKVFLNADYCNSNNKFTKYYKDYIII